MKPGTSLFSGPILNDEIRITYLQKRLISLEENMDRKMREHEIRLKSRIHSYGRAFLEMIQTTLTDKLKFQFVQLDFM